MLPRTRLTSFRCPSDTRHPYLVLEYILLPTGTTVCITVYRIRCYLEHSPPGPIFHAWYNISSLVGIVGIVGTVAVPKKDSVGNIWQSFCRAFAEHVSFGIYTLLVVEQSTLENCPRGVWYTVHCTLYTYCITWYIQPHQPGLLEIRVAFVWCDPTLLQIATLVRHIFRFQVKSILYIDLIYAYSNYCWNPSGSSELKKRPTTWSNCLC